MKILFRCPVPSCRVQVWVKTQHYPVHCACGFTQHSPDIGLGDRVAAALHMAGITKHRYLRLKRRFGLAPTCGCDRRRERLNKMFRRGKNDTA